MNNIHFASWITYVYTCYEFEIKPTFQIKPYAVRYDAYHTYHSTMQTRCIKNQLEAKNQRVIFFLVLTTNQKVFMPRMLSIDCDNTLPEASPSLY